MGRITLTTNQSMNLENFKEIIEGGKEITIVAKGILTGLTESKDECLPVETELELHIFEDAEIYFEEEITQTVKRRL